MVGGKELLLDSLSSTGGSRLMSRFLVIGLLGFATQATAQMPTLGVPGVPGLSPLSSSTEPCLTEDWRAGVLSDVILGFEGTRTACDELSEADLACAGGRVCVYCCWSRTESPEGDLATERSHCLTVDADRRARRVEEVVVQRLGGGQGARRRQFLDYDGDDVWDSVNLEVLNDNGAVVEGRYSSGEELDLVVFYTYDEQGRLVESLSDRDEDKSLDARYEHEYSPNSSIERHYLLPSESVQSLMSHEYGSLGRVTRTVHGTVDAPSFVTDNEYDSAGRLVRRSFDNGRGWSGVTYSWYDDMGRVVRRSTDNGENGTIDRELLYYWECE